MALPSGYTPLKYIETNGQQYIDLGIKPTNNTEVEIRVSNWLLTDSSTALFGTQSSSGDRYDLFITTGNLLRSYYGGAYVTFGNTVNCVDDITVVRSKNIISIGNSTLANTAKTFSCSTKLFLFAHNTNGSPSKHATLRATRCKVRENGVLVRNCEACLAPDGVAGLYDDVYGVFYPSIGSSAFIAGPVAEPTGSRVPIDAASYEITGGKPMLGGAVYDIVSGKAMIGGAVHEIWFGAQKINFTVNLYGVGELKYQAEDGMTWSEWINSRYRDNRNWRIRSSDSLVIVDNCGVFQDSGYLNEVVGSDIIRNGYTYYAAD